MGPFIFSDIETTGREPGRDHIIEVAAVKWIDFQVTAKFESLVKPGVKIPYEIELLTGINDKMLADAPTFSEVRTELCDFFEDLPIIGHNIPFDTSFLKIQLDGLKNPEIDTLVLSKILLRKEPSYALEVLAKKYGLPARGSHRAMADVATTVDFFEFLLAQISEIEEPIWAELKRALEKSQWPGKMIFIKTNKKPTTKKIKKTAKISVPIAQKPPIDFWSDETMQALDKNKKILLESSAEMPLESRKNDKLVIAYEGYQKRHDFLAAAVDARLNVIPLKEPSFYLSPKKLNVKLSADILPVEETPFLLRLILWNNQTETGDREEISLEREEYGFFESLCDNEGADIYWKKAALEAAKSDVVLVHHYGLARGLAKNLSGQLVILEASRLEESFTNAHRKRITEANLRPFFGEKATIIMGFLGIFYEHFVDPDVGGYRGNVILDEEKRNSMEWKRAISAIQNLPDVPKRDFLIKAFVPSPNTVQWISSFADEIIFNSAPINLGAIFNECIANFSHILLHDPVLSGDGSFKLIRKLFELDSEWQEVKENTASVPVLLDLKLHKNFPAPYSDGYFKKCIGLFSEIIETKKGKSLFLLSSKKTVEAMYSALLPKAESAGVKLLGIGPSGGIGKSLALFLDKPASSILISTNQILPHLQEFEQNIETIVFQKIPFDPPGDPLLSLRAAQFENGFEEYTLPRAIMRFRGILNSLGQGSKKTCHLLDSRLLNRDYGQMFMKA